MSENAENNWHLWRPSVISVRDETSETNYSGNVITGPNFSKAEIETQIGGKGAELTEEIRNAGDEVATDVQNTMQSLLYYSAVMADSVTGLREALLEAFGEPEISVIQFTLDVSYLGVGELA